MKILIVEPKRVLMYLLQNVPFGHGYQVESFAEQQAGLPALGEHIEPVLRTGAQANFRFESIADAGYDLIIVDAAWTAPTDLASRLDGVSLCQQLRVQGIQIPILLLTEPETDQGLIALRAGANDYLTKPVEAEALRSRMAFVQHHHGHHHPQAQTRERLLADITDAIHQTLELDQILHTAVTQVRKFLQADRVIVFRFQPDWQGVVEAESVAPGWIKTLGMNIKDACFNEQYVKTYRQGRVSAISDIKKTTVAPCYVELLNSVQVWANLVVPIVQENHLWGLLIAHQCGSARRWSADSTQLLKRVATHLGIAIQQAELYQKTHHELVERRRIQQALQASEERFRSLSAFAPVGIYQTDLEGHCIYTNAKWQEIAGLTLEESLGNSWGQAIHPDDREKVFTTWERFIAGEGDFSLEFRFFKKLEREERWVFGRAIAMRSPTGEVIGYVGVNEDITERKRAEHKIHEQAALIDIATDAIFVRDLSGQIVFWSNGAAQLYGWSRQEAMGKNVRQLFKTQGLVDPEVAISITLKQGFWQGELTHTTKAGNPILVASRWTLVCDSTGRPQSLLEVNTDITEKKQLEDQFYQAQRLESLGQLASGVAHDLGNVLTPIQGIAQLLRITLQDLDETTQEYIEILEKSAKRGTTMVKQILTFAQGSPDDGTTVDITTLLKEVIDVARQGIPSNIEIHQHLSEGDTSPPLKKEVSVSSTHLHQVFMNLCINARDAMPEGGSLTILVENAFIDETTAGKSLVATSIGHYSIGNQPVGHGTVGHGTVGHSTVGQHVVGQHSIGQYSVGHYVVVTVADTGIGIAPEIRDRIFDPFFTTKGPDKGTGLGLATVIGIVKNAGGFLQVFSEVGQGTDIKVYFPVVERGNRGHL